MSLIPPTISITNCTDGLKVNVDASNQISISPQSIELSCDNNMFTALVAETPKDITNIAYLNVLEELFINGISFDDYITTISPTFTGNTSGSCISELYVHNLGGCSPINVTTDMIVNGKLGINITPTYDLHVNGSTNIIGNLTVLGTATLMGSGTTFYTQNVSVDDNIVTLNSTFTAGTPFLDSGVEVMRGDEVPAQFLWNESTDEWTVGLSGDMHTIITSETLSGTTNYIPKFTDSHKLGNSLIYDNGIDLTMNGNVKIPSSYYISTKNVVDPTGVGPYITLSSTQLAINSRLNNRIALDVQGVASQSADIFRVSNVAGGAGNYFVVKSDGKTGIGTTAPMEQLEITKNFRLPSTTYNSGSTYGVIYKDNNRFIHDFNYGWNGTVATNGNNTFVGVLAGNFTMGSTATIGAHAAYNSAFGNQAFYSNTIGYQNTAIGYSSLKNNTTGYRNSALGSSSLGSNITGNNNIAVGFGSLGFNTDGTNNSALGSSSLGANTTGNNNTAVGASSLTANITGNENTTIGVTSLYKNTTGYRNCALGVNSLFSNITGYENIAIGHGALYSNISGNTNIAIGSGALYLNTTGNKNSSIGKDSLGSNTTGNENSAVGNDTLKKNTIGNGNSAFGYYALYSNNAGNNGVAIGYESQRYVNDTTTPWTNSNVSIGYQSLRGSTTAANNTGLYNVAIGYNTMMNNTSGGYNTAIGYYSLNVNTSGVGNVAIGYSSLSNSNTAQNNVAVGMFALSSNTSGHNNLAIGKDSARFIKDGITYLLSASNSIFLGTLTKGNANGETNQIVIGYDATGLGSNTVVLGNPSITTTRLQGNVGIGTDTPDGKLDVNGNVIISGKTQITSSVQIGDDTTGASSINAGAIRYRSDSNNSYCEMVMQTGSTEYGWVIIKQNTW